MGKKVSISSVICFILAAGFLAADIAAIVSLSGFLSNSETVQGRVVDYQKQSGGNRRGPSYLYTVQFTASDGRVYQTYTRSGSHEKGDSITVTYDRRNPEDAAASTMDQWIFVVIFTAGAIISLMVGIRRVKAT